MIKLSESAQELLEQLWIATQEEDQAGLIAEDHPPESVDELAGQGLVEQEDNWLSLTALGLPEAAQAVRRHRLAERLLTDVLSTPEAVMDEQACRCSLPQFPVRSTSQRASAGELGIVRVGDNGHRSPDLPRSPRKGKLECTDGNRSSG